MLDFMEEPFGMCRGRCLHRPAGLPEDSDFLGLPYRNRPAEFARSSLSALGLLTPVVDLACTGNVDIQVFSDAGCQVLFLRRLQVCIARLPFRGAVTAGD